MLIANRNEIMLYTPRHRAGRRDGETGDVPFKSQLKYNYTYPRQTYVLLRSYKEMGFVKGLKVVPF